MIINTVHNVYSEKLIWKSIGRRWITNFNEHPLLSMITIPLNILDPFYQRLIFLPFIAGSSKKWIEQHLKSEEIKFDVHKSSNVELVDL